MKKVIPLMMILALISTARGQSLPLMRTADKVRIKEAINISNRFGDKIWPGINSVPFVVLLVTDSMEFFDQSSLSIGRF